MSETACLLSGGVDSSVALWSIKERGDEEIRAYYLKIWLEDELSYLGSCPWEEDLEYARAVCEEAGVPLEVVPLQREYYDRVVSYTVEELKRGRTPSPDIFCNERIKFGAFLDAVQGEVDRVASGHYAILETDAEGKVWLRRSPDPVKDQSYFLFHLRQEQLRRILFPIGSMTKEQVRRRAEELDLPNKQRPDSQGICFLGKIKYPEFVRYYLGEREGDIREAESGRKLGTHRGSWFFTIGQRQGLGLGNGPWYVVDKSFDENIVYVSHAESMDRRARNRLTVGDLTWLTEEPEQEEFLVKLRHGPQLNRATARRLESEGKMELTLAEADRGIAPGQFAVLYNGEYCLGGGTILG
ncbi:MAG: tRNA 2-thiouridine(34) synthase MnmA [Alkalispirochaetaceae bacterium]